MDVKGEQRSHTIEHKDLKTHTIAQAKVTPEHRVKHSGPGTTMSVLPHDRNHLIFNEGHSEPLYEGGMGWIHDDAVWEVTDEGGLTNRYLVVDASRLATNPLFKIDASRQRLLFRVLVDEINHSLVGQVRDYRRDIAEEGLTESQRRSIGSGLKFLESEIPREKNQHFVNNEAVLNFIKTCRASGIDCDAIPYAKDVEAIAKDNLTILEGFSGV